jgi:ribonuclease Z
MSVPQDLVLAGHPIRALSIGGIETCFEVPGFDVCLDIGRCPPGAERRGTLLLTHGHIDHAAGLPYYISMRALYRHPEPKVYVPASALPHVQKMLEAWVALQADTDRCRLTGVEAGDVIPLPHDKAARVFRSPHRIDCVGYTLMSRVRKLKPELSGLGQEQIAERARSGEVVQELIERPEICFPGDTLIDVLEKEEMVQRARVLLLECTFMETRVPVEKARRGGHVHLDEIAARADLFQNEVLVLTHFSRRYRPDEIRSAVASKLPAHLLERTKLLIHDDETHAIAPG